LPRWATILFRNAVGVGIEPIKQRRIFLLDSELRPLIHICVHAMAFTNNAG